jgi:hypothetical protein
MDTELAQPPQTSALEARVAPVFSHRGFALFWVARMCAALAVQAESVTIGWQVYTIAREARSVEQSAFLVGMVGLSQFVPLFMLTLFAGTVADRCDRRVILQLCVVVEMFVVAAVFGASRAFMSPAEGALGPMLVPRDVLPRAISWSSLGDQGCSVIGPWLGGALCAVSPVAAYGSSAVLYAAAAAALLLIRANTRPPLQAGSRFAHIREGLAYVWTNKIVLGAISLDLLLKVGAHGFGVLRSGPAIGAVAMAFALTRWPLHRRAGHWMFGGVAAFGVATLVFAVSRSMLVSLIALIALGAADMISVYVRQTLVQLVTPDRMRGRVSAVAGLFISGSAELGAFETGVVARVLGPVGAAIFGGVGSLLVTGIWSRLFPALRKADRLDGPQA